MICHLQNDWLYVQYMSDICIGSYDLESCMNAFKTANVHFFVHPLQKSSQSAIKVAIVVIQLL